MNTCTPKFKIQLLKKKRCKPNKTCAEYVFSNYTTLLKEIKEDLNK